MLLLIMLIHVIDELDALTLIAERRVGEGRPAAVLALIFVGRPVLRRRKSYGIREASNGNGGDDCISGGAYL